MNLKLTKFFEQDKKLLIKVIAGVILLVIAFAFYLMKEQASDQDKGIFVIPDSGIASNDQTSESAVEDKKMMMIDVAGAVLHPSVIELQEGGRVFQAIENAGGLTKDADTNGINQAEILSDGQKIYIPTKQELAALNEGTGVSAPTGHNTAPLSKLININTADSETLQQLTGVGPATAEKIINYRIENGKFKNIDEMKNVNGIGDKTFEKFKNKITV